MSTQINLDVLKSFKVDLYNAVVESLSLGPITGLIQVSNLQWFGFPEAVRNRLVEFLRLQAPNPEHDPKTCGCNSCFAKRVAEQQRSEAARLEVEKQNVPGQLRLNEYMTRPNDQGQVLLNNDFNKDVFWKFLDEKFPGLTVITPKHVDVFIQAKRLELQWARPQSIPAPVPTPQPESVLLSDGSLQKGLDESPSRSWSLAQLKDYDRRKRLQASGESESLPPLEYIRSGKIVSEPRLPLGTKITPQFSPEQIRDLNIRTANAHARATGSHGGGGASWFESRGL